MTDEGVSSHVARLLMTLGMVDVLSIGSSMSRDRAIAIAEPPFLLVDRNPLVRFYRLSIVTNPILSILRC